MTSGRLRSLGGSALLTLVGVFALAGSTPRVAFSSTLPACLSESAGTAWLGLHLSLLSQDPACPGGLFAPGEHYAEFARFSVMLSLSAVIVGVLALLGALGFGVWARVALRRARAWISQRFTLPALATAVRSHRGPMTAARARGLHSAFRVDLQPLRGPPIRVSA